MEERQIHSSDAGLKPCKVKPLSSYPTKFATFTTFCYKNFSNQVDFQSNEKLPCKNTWYRDIKSTHIRNKHLLDLSFTKPKCCSNIYNMVGDRQKLKKLNKYGLTRPIRKGVSDLEMEELEICDPGEATIIGTTEGAGLRMEDVCFWPGKAPAGDSSDEDSDSDDEYKFCSSGSLSECSGCSTLGGGTRRKRHKLVKKDWRDLLHVPGAELCRESVASEIKKHKMGYDLTLKLKKIF